MSNVWVTQETNHDFRPAEQFGDVHFLTHMDFNNNRASQANEALLSDLSHKLRKYDPEEDYIVITGSPYVSAAVFMIIGHRKIKRVKILRWDNRDFKYIPLYIEFRQETING